MAQQLVLVSLSGTENRRPRRVFAENAGIYHAERREWPGGCSHVPGRDGGKEEPVSTGFHLQFG
ncbi:hypothetical protein IE4803_CH01143 [Rhizobium etli bv. phaseoli str. IE4803]|nr:hypothetical protein IE4803_CH01143 [Rhizobium etli bv. phaseoli str. IE4803]